MSNKLKNKDDSTNKFLQRIAGKKALGPPPTPRPIIGEHPVRILIRENSDGDEKPRHRSSGNDAPQSDTPPDTPPDTPLPRAPLDAADAPPETEAKVAVHPITGGGTTNQKGDAHGLNHDLRATLVAEKSSRRHSADEGEKRARQLEANQGSPPAAGSVLVSTRLGNAPGNDLDEIKKKYRLNSGEFALYKELYMMSHAVGRTECSFVVSELMEATGMLERRVRDNIRRLRQSGWIVMVNAYDSVSREKSKYRINTEPGF